MESWESGGGNDGDYVHDFPSQPSSQAYQLDVQQPCITTQSQASAITVYPAETAYHKAGWTGQGIVWFA